MTGPNFLNQNILILETGNLAILLLAIMRSLREGGCVCHVTLQIAASSYVRIIVLFLLPITTSICMDYREQLVDLPGSLMLRYGIS